MFNTRSTNYLRTRSGKRYARYIPEKRNFDSISGTTTFVVSQRDSKRPKVEVPEVDEPETVPPMDWDGEYEYDNETATVSRNHSLTTVGGNTFHQWENEVKTILRESFEMSDEDMSLYPFYNWFLAKRDAVEVANSVKRDFYHDEHSHYEHTFLEWQQEVDTLITNRMSMSRFDLPDFPYYDFFLDSTTPIQMVNYIQGQLFV